MPVTQGTCHKNENEVVFIRHLHLAQIKENIFTHWLSPSIIDDVCQNDGDCLTLPILILGVDS